MDKLDENPPYESKTEPAKEFEEDVTRESLIEIAYLAPNNGVAAAPMSPKYANINKADEPLIHDGKELYRDKLISISNAPSPAANAQPHLSPQIDA